MVTQRLSQCGFGATVDRWLALWLSIVFNGCQPGDTVLPPPRALPPGSPLETAVPYFFDVTRQVQLEFVHHAGGASQFHFPAVMSPGAAWLDFDRDGDLDLAVTDGWLASEVTGGSALGTNRTPTACRLFRQDGGKFVDATADVGLSHAGYGMGLAVGDVNNDGFPDLYLTCVGQDRLFVNDGGHTFVDVTEAAGIDNVRWGTSAAFFDFDRDGRLDLFVTNYVDYDRARPCFTPNGSQDFCNPAMFPRTASKLFHNVTPHPPRGTGDRPAHPTVKFADASVASGIASKSGAGLGVTCCDFNADGWVDIYVANDGHANFLWINQRDGTFRDEAGLLGVDTDALGRGQGSMGIAVGDVNADQRPDIFVTNLDGETNVLYASQPGGVFREAAAASGLATPSFPFTGFGAALLDIDHDGDLDLVAVNGRVRRAASSALTERSHVSDFPEFWQPYVEAHHLFLNHGEGRFRLARGPPGDFAASVGIGRALAVGDYDNDGDLDLLVSHTAGRLQIFRNDTAKHGHWLMLRAIDPRHGGRDVYGAVVTVVRGDQSWTASVNPGSSYLASHDPRLHFGVGEAAEFDRVDVTWPDGRQESFAGGPTDRVVTIAHGQGTPR